MLKIAWVLRESRELTPWERCPVLGENYLIEKLSSFPRQPTNQPTSSPPRAHLPLSSDFPVEKVNPFLGIYAAVSRRDVNNNPSAGWFILESLSAKDAMRGFTTEAAYAGFQEKDLGSISIGKFADFVVTDRNIFTEHYSKIHGTQVHTTVLDGKVVHGKGFNQYYHR